MNQQLFQLECNIDDMNPQFYPVIIEQMLAAGANDVWLVPVIMKHGRPGVILGAIVAQSVKERIVDLVLRETSALGLRFWPIGREALERRVEEVSTEFGPVQLKLGLNADGVLLNAAPEFSSCRSLAANGPEKSLKRVYLAAQAACAKFFV